MRRLGYTEPNPAEDLNGLDVARKALILARELGIEADLADVRVGPLVPAELLESRSADELLARLEAAAPTVAAPVAEVETISRAAHLDVGGIEYLVDDRDGRHYCYDVNALSNFVADAPNAVGFDPLERFADYLEARAYGVRTTMW